MFLVLMGMAFAADAARTLDVTGRGEVWVAPDEAVLSLGVRSEARTASAAFDAAATATATVVAAVEESVPADRVRTSQLSLSPRYDYSGKTPALIGYQASAMLEIRVDDPTAAAGVLDDAVAAGANEIGGVYWQVEDEEASAAAALDAAVADARANAVRVAEALGVGLGAPLSVDIRMQDDRPGPYRLEVGADTAAIAEMPLLSGEQIYRAEVYVRFEIAEVPAT